MNKCVSVCVSLPAGNRRDPGQALEEQSEPMKMYWGETGSQLEKKRSVSTVPLHRVQIYPNICGDL